MQGWALRPRAAGRSLTIATMLALRDAGDPLPAAGATLSAWLDLAGTGASNTEKAQADPIVTMDGLRQMATWYLGGQTAQTWMFLRRTL